MRSSFFLIISLALVVAIQFVSQTNSCCAESETKNAILETYSIPLLPYISEEVRLRNAEADRMAKEGTVVCYGKPSPPKGFCYPLTKPDQRNVVALLLIEPNGAYTLNPDGWGDYGPIPHLTSLTITDANRLWGENRNARERQEQGRKTFDLVYSASGEVKQLHLDLVFRHKLLQKYRIRTKEFAPNLSFEWRAVN